MKSSNFACCCRKLLPAGLVVSSFKVRCMRSWRPFCCGLPGLMRSISMPSLSHHTDTLLSPKSALGLAKGTPLSVRMALGRPNSALLAFREEVERGRIRGLEWEFPRAKDGTICMFNMYEFALMDISFRAADVLRTWPDWPATLAWNA